MTSKILRVAVSVGSLTLLCLAVVSASENSPAQRPVSVAAAPPALPVTNIVVKYQAGALTVTAWNASLIEVLRAICGKVGASLDASGLANEQITVNLGPGSAQAVLESMLKNSGLNYAVTGSLGDANAHAQIFILPRSAAPDAQSQTAPPSVVRIPAVQTQVGMVSREKQLAELLGAARSELASLGRPPVSDPDHEEGTKPIDPGGTARDVGALARFLTQAESKITANLPDDSPQR